MGAHPSCSQDRDNDVLFGTGAKWRKPERDFNIHLLARIDVD